MDLEVRHARLVVAVAQAGSISAGAVVLGLPQPGVTAQLRRIERACGGPLFVRSRRRVSPTPLGERVLPLMVRLCRVVEAVASEASGAASTSLVLGIADRASPGLVRALRTALPDLDLATVTVAGDGRALLRDGGVDALVEEAVAGAAVVLSADHDRVVLRQHRVRLLLPPAHRLLGDEVDPSALEREHWVLRSPEAAWAPVERAVLRSLQVPAPRCVHRALTHGEVAEWVVATRAVAVVPEWFRPAGCHRASMRRDVTVELALVHRCDSLTVLTRRRLVEVLSLHLAGGWDHPAGPSSAEQGQVGDLAPHLRADEQARLVGVPEVDAAEQA
ncbi:LysR family transcriptional regulator [Jannaschia sp. R86511]|uniref:LysR family transcriptional regulator n=1 Tax=Jannaschia sp. R86511 TaxID=3093853 RepID=UPI0036D40820